MIVAMDSVSRLATGKSNRVGDPNIWILPAECATVVRPTNNLAIIVLLMRSRQTAELNDGEKYRLQCADQRGQSGADTDRSGREHRSEKDGGVG